MPDQVTDEQLAEWEALADAATEGPWTVAEDAELHDAPVLTPGGWTLCASPDDGVRGGHELSDAQFIAASRTAVPLLVRALRDARDENERLRIQMSALHIANDSLAASAAPTGQSDQTQVHNSAIPADNPAFIAHRYGIAHTDCWCARCESEAKDRLIASGQLGSIEALCGFMHLCPDCGNKRCPRATWHGNDCKSSNRPGQPGSDYPAAPTGQETDG